MKSDWEAVLNVNIIITLGTPLPHSGCPDMHGVNINLKNQ